MSIVPSTHDCLDHYELRSVNELFKCQGCKMAGFGQGFQCKLCNDTLHRECRYPKATTTHEFFGSSTLEFRDKPVLKRRDGRTCSTIPCDACGKDISGFNYNSVQDNIDVHPCCLNLRTTHVINGDKVLHLTKAKVVVSKCMWCKKKKNDPDYYKNEFGWSYSSSCGKYHIHVYCMLDVIHDACTINGNTGLELDKVDIRTLAKQRGGGRKWSTSVSKTYKMIKSITKILCSALLGDSSLLLSSAFVEVVSRRFES